MKPSPWRWNSLTLLAGMLLLTLAVVGWVSTFDLAPVHVVNVVP